jgi:hypothetical protein
MKSYQTKKIELPGGKFIEVVVFGDQNIESSSNNHDAHTTVTTEMATETWEITLRCPDCEWWHTGEFADDAVDEFDEVLNDGTEQLLESLRTFARVNMEEDIERFVRAIEIGLIEPMDF